jgi:hypothetical protein
MTLAQQRQSLGRNRIADAREILIQERGCAMLVRKPE